MLKDIAKVLIGIFLADMSYLIYLLATNTLPVNLFNLEWGFASVMILILVDFAILILLTYYAWLRKPKKKIKKEEAVVEAEEKVEDKIEERR